MEPVLLYDTTLRDGTQGENINFSVGEKLNIARRLDDIGIHYIEGGWPGSNPKDMHFFDQIKKETFQHAKITAFGSTRRPGLKPGSDLNLKALLDSETEAVAIFGKSWTLHVKKIMDNTLNENLKMIEDSVAYLRNNGREVIYDAEHFFDGYRENSDYALKTLSAAVEGGATMLVLCDTNGGTLPFDIEAAIDSVSTFLDERYPAADGGRCVDLGIHTHNDSGMAVANSVVAVRAGATMVQGTVNGYGERCGNADLTSIIPVLSIKMNRSCISEENIKKLKKLSRFGYTKAFDVKAPSTEQPYNARQHTRFVID